MDIYNGMKFQNAKGFWWEVVDCSVSRKIVVKSLEWMPYTTEIRKESVQKGVVMYPYGKNKYGGYRGEGEWDLSKKNPYMGLWMGMFSRCYTSTEDNNPSYINTKVGEEFCNFQIFCNWVEKHKPKDTDISWELDKDLLGDGTIYSPSTCCFLPKELNLFLSKLNTSKGIYEHVCEDGTIKYRLWVREGKEKEDNHYVGSYNSYVEAEEKYKEIKNKRLHSLIEKYKQLLPANVLEALYKLEK
jgi:hypothetical protein